MNKLAYISAFHGFYKVNTFFIIIHKFDKSFSIVETMSPPYDWQATKCIAECNKHMLANQIACDVGFLVGDEQELVMAHKYVMISRSCVFYAMLHGLMAENADEYISIPDIDKETFKQMLE